MSYESPARAEQLYKAAEIKALASRDAAQALSPDLDERLLPSDQALLSMAIRELERRTVRLSHLPAELFPDTGWVILLDLFISELQARTIRIADSALRWDVSEVTAVRQIAALIESDLVMRVVSKGGDEAVLLRLTSQGTAILKWVLAHEVSQGTPRLVRSAGPSETGRLADRQ